MAQAHLFGKNNCNTINKTHFKCVYNQSSPYRYFQLNKHYLQLQHHITMKYENQDGKLQTKSHET